jgi:hypothetical protein
MNIVQTTLLVFAFVLFVISTFRAVNAADRWSRVNLVALGLAFVVAAQLVGMIGGGHR